MDTGIKGHVCILNGIHRGAVVPIGDRPVVLGDTEDCDAILSDRSVRGRSVRLCVSDAGEIVATPLQGEVTRDGRRVRPDRSASLREGTVLGVGDVRIASGSDLSATRHAVRRSSRQRTLFHWMTAAAATLALFSLLGTVGGRADAVDRAHERSTVASVRALASSSFTDPQEELRRRIAAEELAGSVSVKTAAADRLIASGTLTPGQHEVWHSIVRWFDGRFGDRVLLESRFSERADDIVLPFEIVSVVTAPGPRIVIQNGHVYPVGSVLPGGWEVRRIASMSVVLARGDRELAIAF